MTTISTVTAPSTRAVGRYVADRLQANDAPGVEVTLGDFGPNTTPTNGEVADLIASALDYVQARLGAVIDSTLGAQATDVVAQRAAAMIELAYPRASGDLSTYDRLLALATDGLSELTDLNQVLTGSASTAATSSVPVGIFPDPVPWGDAYL